MQLIKLFFPLILVFVATGITSSHASGSDAKEGEGRSSVIIDVRSSEEYNSGHIEGAANINYTEIGSVIEDLVPGKDTTIRLYCGSGHRAGIAKNTLEEMGYTNVVNEGGYEEFREKISRDN